MKTLIDIFESIYEAVLWGLLTSVMIFIIFAVMDSII